MIAYYAEIWNGEAALAKVIIEKETPKLYKLARRAIDPGGSHPFFITGWCPTPRYVKKSDGHIFLVREDAIDAIREQFGKISNGLYDAITRLNATRVEFEEALEEYERNKESNG